MINQARIFKNVIYVLFSGVLGKLINVLFIMYAARVLGPVQFGFYGLINAFIFLFSFAQDLGVGPVAVRELAKRRDNPAPFFNLLLSLRLLLSVAVYPILGLTVLLLNYNEEITELLLIAGLTLIFQSFTASFHALYMAFERMAFPSMLGVLVSLVHSLACIAVLYLGYGLPGVIWTGLVVSFSNTLIASIWVYRNILPYRLIYDFGNFRNILQQAVPFAIIGFFNIIINRNISLLILSKLKGPLSPDLALGYYNAASSIPYALMLIPESIRISLLPPVAANIHDKNIVQKVIELTVKILLLLVGLPLIIITISFPELLISFVFGEKYLAAAPALTVLGLAYAIHISTVPLVVVLSATPDIRRFVPAVVTGGIINLAAAIALVPFYSFQGAAIAVLITMLYSGAMCIIFLKKLFGLTLFNFYYWIKLILLLLSVIISLWFASYYFKNMFVLLIIAILLYSTATYVSGVLSAQDKTLLIKKLSILYKKRDLSSLFKG